MRKVIAFCGFEQAGKDYSAKRLVTTMGFKKEAFADALREVAFKIIGLSYEKGMEQYELLKQTELINGLTFRNILENLGSAIRKFDRDFWAKSVLKYIDSCTDNICISDLRYTNEYWVLKEYCEKNNISLKLIFCDFKSPGQRDDNPHESAQLARYLKNLGYTDQEYVNEEDLVAYDGGMQ